VEAFDSWTSPVLGKGRKEGEVKGQGWRGKMGRLEVTGIGVEEGEAGRLNSSLEGGRGKELSIPYLYFPLFSLFPWLFSSLQRERFFFKFRFSLLLKGKLLTPTIATKNCLQTIAPIIPIFQLSFQFYSNLPTLSLLPPFFLSLALPLDFRGV
jgi:hypothetical protein